MTINSRWVLPLEWAGGRPLFSSLAQDGSPTVPQRAWRPLFNGQNFENWSVDDKKELWVVENNAIHCLGKGGGYLRTLEQFGDFALACEFRVDKGTNSGIFVRWSNVKDPVNTGIEVQVLDSAGKAKPGVHDAGAIYDLVAPSVNTMKPAGQWNRLVITCQGPYLSTRLNGARVSEIDVSRYTLPGRNPDGSKNKFRYALASLPRRGYIGLQNHGGGVWYRNLLLLPLS